jgi:hypothetical protein
MHQEFGKVLLRPRELMSPVVSGYERHKSVTALFWAHNASLVRVGTHEVIQPAIGCTSLVSFCNCIASRYDLVYQVCVKCELVSYL